MNNSKVVLQRDNPVWISIKARFTETFALLMETMLGEVGLTMQHVKNVPEGPAPSTPFTPMACPRTPRGPSDFYDKEIESYQKKKRRTS